MKITWILQDKFVLNKHQYDLFYEIALKFQKFIVKATTCK